MSRPDDADDLYGLALEEFVGARDSLARRLRAEGDADAAKEVKGMRKPSVSAWAANQALRTQPDRREELLAAGEELRRAHEAVLSGRGASDELERATARERRAVEGLVEAARGLVSGRGRFLDESVIQGVRQTLHAAVTDEDVRGQVAAGRIDRDRVASGLGMAGVPAPAAGGRPRPAKRPRSTPRPASSGRAADERRARLAEARRRLEEARDRARTVRGRAAEARKAVRAAEREHAGAQKRLEAARAASERAAAEVTRAEEDVAAAEREVGKARG